MAFKEVSVLGAAGKMGMGIGALLALHMAKQKKTGHLRLIDTNEEGLKKALDYIGEQVKRAAVKEGQDPDAALKEVQSFTTASTETKSAAKSDLVFEAIVENEDVKHDVYRQLHDICSWDTVFFTNTSSIPIDSLEEAAHLRGRILGFHFYNPPLVQKLVEIIPSQFTSEELFTKASKIGKALDKVLVPSKDVAGFIGNGFFVREGIHALNSLAGEAKGMLATGIYLLNEITKTWLIRPMGIFQLLDYVGLDVFHMIGKVMNKHLEADGMQDPLIQAMLTEGIYGGQEPGGKQKPGFFKYDKGQIVATYDPEKGEYVELDPKSVLDLLGPIPESHLPWKEMRKAPARAERLEAYFKEIFSGNTRGCQLTREYMRIVRSIGVNLVKDGVAQSPNSVNQVMQLGFQHLWGPIYPATWEQKHLSEEASTVLHSVNLEDSSTSEEELISNGYPKQV